MPKTHRLLPVALTLVLLAGCGDGTSISSLTSGGNGDPPPSGAPAPSPSSASPSASEIPPGQEGDSPPPGAGHHASPPPTSDIVSACALVTKGDIFDATRGSVKITFSGNPREDRVVSPLTGDTSTCHMPLQSEFPDQTGISVVGGEVVVRIQSAGTDEFFPARPGDTEIDGLGDEAIARNGRVYVRLEETYVLTVSAGISSNSADPLAQKIKWATQLARVALAKLR
jgi:hypothetical protein